MRYLLFLFVILLSACGGSNTNESEQGEANVACICSGQPPVAGKVPPPILVLGTGNAVEEAQNNAKLKCSYVFLPNSCMEL